MAHFTNFLNFYATPNIHLSEENILNKLQIWIDNSQYKPLDIINYEELIYFELYFKDNQNVQNKIQELKQIIHDNYKFKQQLIYKVTHNIRK